MKAFLIFITLLKILRIKSSYIIDLKLIGLDPFVDPYKELPSFDFKSEYYSIGQMIDSTQLRFRYSFNAYTYFIESDRTKFPFTIKEFSSMNCKSDLITGEFGSAKICYSNLNVGGNCSIPSYLLVVNAEGGFQKLPEKTHGVIGLAMTTTITDDFSNNFFKILKANDLINSYDFHFTFDTNLNAKLIIGTRPDIYNSSYYNESFYDYKKIYSRSSYDQHWSMRFDNIAYGNISFKNTSVDFDLDQFYVAGSIYYNETVYTHFFRKYIDKNLCKYILRGDNYVYICNNDINFNDFQDLNFYSNELNYTFTLTKYDLFKDYNDKKVFMVIFKEDKLNWALGPIFFNKYIPVFNSDSKTIGFYIPKDKNQVSEKKGGSVNYVLIIFCILFSITIVFLIKYVIKLRNNKRKKRATEFEDDFTYDALNNLKGENEMKNNLN